MEDKYQYTNNKQETPKLDKCNINTTGIPNSNTGDNPMVTNNINSKTNYFIPCPQQEAVKMASA